MPIREPGVIVNISGEDLPPPLPETRYGIGFYILGRSGPYKPTFVNIRNIAKVYTDIPPIIENELNYLLPATSMYCMLLPNLGIRTAVGFATTSDAAGLQTLGYINANNEVLPRGQAIFAIPTWLNGLPKHIRIWNDDATNWLNSLRFSQILRIEVNRKELYNVDYTATNFTNIPIMPINSEVFDAISIIALINPNNNREFILWFRVPGSKDNHIIYKRQVGTNEDQIVYYTDANSPISDIEIHYLDHNSNSGNLTLSSSTNAVEIIGGSNALLKSLILVSPSRDNTTAEMRITSAGGYELRVTSGTQTVRYPISYSPLDEGFYGFIDEERIEMFLKGDVYSDLTDTSSSTTYSLVYNGQAASPFFTDIPFNHGRHEGRVPARYFDSTYGLHRSQRGSPTTSDPFSIGQNYVISLGWTYLSDFGSMYKDWVDGMHDSLLYRETDVQRFTYSPLEVDLISDYSNKLGFFFTNFIRSHDKFMFKILGSPNLVGIPYADRYDAIDQYWGLFDLQGFHYIRLQGNSLTSISGSTIYIKAVNDYGYKPIFGLSAALSLSESDHEFRLAHRENLLDKNVNSMVKDRVLSLWYFNNNLTEESLRDTSPLGEENNARAAIRIAKLLAVFVERYIGQPNNRLTRERITNEVSRFILTWIESSKANIAAYRVICDETNNTPADIANNRLNIRVEAKFGKSIKYIVVFARTLMST